MYEFLIIGIFVVLICIIVWGIIRHIFGLLFKIAVFLLIAIIVLAGIVYVDLYTNELIGDTALVFMGDETFGYELVNGSLGDELDVEVLEKIQNQELGNYTLAIYIEGNYDETVIDKLSGKYKRYIDLLKVFKNDRISFYPKSFTLNLIEKIRG